MQDINKKHLSKKTMLCNMEINQRLHSSSDVILYIYDYVQLHANDNDLRKHSSHFRY